MSDRDRVWVSLMLLGLGLVFACLAVATTGWLSEGSSHFLRGFASALGFCLAIAGFRHACDGGKR